MLYYWISINHRVCFDFVVCDLFLFDYWHRFSSFFIFRSLGYKDLYDIGSNVFSGLTNLQSFSSLLPASFFTLFYCFGVFSTIILIQLNLGLSMDSTTFELSFPSSPLPSCHFNLFLFLNGNHLATLPSGVFSNLNGLSSLPLFPTSDSFRSHSLYLHYNSLSSISSDFFEGLENLLYLLFHLSFVPFLFSLQLNGNQLTTLPSDAFSNVKRLNSLSNLLFFHLHSILSLFSLAIVYPLFHLMSFLVF